MRCSTQKSLLAVLNAAVFSIQTTTDKPSLCSALPELAAALVWFCLFVVVFFFKMMLPQAALRTAFKLLSSPSFSAGRCHWGSAGWPHSDTRRQ